MIHLQLEPYKAYVAQCKRALSTPLDSPAGHFEAIRTWQAPCHVYSVPRTTILGYTGLSRVGHPGLLTRRRFAAKENCRYAETLAGCSPVSSRCRVLSQSTYGRSHTCILQRNPCHQGSPPRRCVRSQTPQVSKNSWPAARILRANC